jgi:hypothetical protein
MCLFSEKDPGNETASTRCSRSETGDLVGGKTTDQPASTASINRALRHPRCTSEKFTPPPSGGLGTSLLRWLRGTSTPTPLFRASATQSCVEQLKDSRRMVPAYVLDEDTGTLMGPFDSGP